MNLIFIIVFIFNITSIIVMVSEVKKRRKTYGIYNVNKRYTIDELRNHKETMKELVYIGISGGILFWGLLIGFIVSLFSSYFHNLLNSFLISTTLAFLPSSLGLFSIYQHKKNSKHPN